MERYHGSIYLAGYAVECALKATICRRQGEVYLPQEAERHIDDPANLNDMLERAGLVSASRRDTDVARALDRLLEYWSVEM